MIYLRRRHNIIILLSKELFQELVTLEPPTGSKRRIKQMKRDKKYNKEKKRKEVNRKRALSPLFFLQVYPNIKFMYKNLKAKGPTRIKKKA